MGLALAATFSMAAWIVLWALGFGRTGDAFIITVPPIMFVAVAVHMIGRKLAQREP
jgi:hypothetical protein